MSRKKEVPDLINLEEMKDAINRSGYLIEQRVETILQDSGYYVETNPAYPDIISGKSREYDVFAMSANRIFKEGFNYIFPILLCECENNSLPVVFFTKDLEFSNAEVNYSGIPLNFLKANEDLSLSEFTGMDKFHHYFDKTISTQYCSFTKKNSTSPWIAFHSEDHHSTFTSLIKALEYQIHKHQESWVIPDDNTDELNLQIYYPVIILQGDLFSCLHDKGGLKLKKADHILYRKEIFLNPTGDSETYFIDVITESYLSKFLEVVDDEMDKTKRALQRRKKLVLASIKNSVKESKEQQNNYHNPQPTSTNSS